LINFREIQGNHKINNINKIAIFDIRGNSAILRDFILKCEYIVNRNGPSVIDNTYCESEIIKNKDSGGKFQGS